MLDDSSISAIPVGPCAEKESLYFRRGFRSVEKRKTSAKLHMHTL